MIILVGTGHILDLSSIITDLFNQKKPDLVCIELDKQRYDMLLLKTSNSNQLKKERTDFPILYKLFARFQDKIAKEFGVNAGDEMIAAIKYAESRQIPFEFIDMNSQELYEKTLQSMSFFEKLKISFIGVLLTFFGWMFISKKRIDEQLKKYENEQDESIDEMGKSYPTIKKILLDERNDFMAKKLINFNSKYKTIIALVGDAHVPGISELLRNSNINFEVKRLKDLQIKD